MQIEKTNRGFKFITFMDDNGQGCSLQKSSSAEDDKIWLGMDSPVPKVCMEGFGWVAIPVHSDILLTGRMHLTREQVKELLPYLAKFVETGELED